MPLGCGLFAGQCAVITGATGAMGEAIARRLAQAGATLVLLGRDAAALTALARDLDGSGAQLHSVQCIDLADRVGIEAAAAALAATLAMVDLFVHCAGVLEPAALAAATLASWDLQFDVNVRAPFVLIRALLPKLLVAQGQIAFINSTVAQQPPRPGLGAYTAAKCALRALADTLRAEVNAHGVRVITLYPGRTAGRMQVAMHAAEGRAYHPEALMQPDDVAVALMESLALPRTAEVTDLSIRPFHKLDDAPPPPSLRTGSR